MRALFVFFVVCYEKQKEAKKQRKTDLKKKPFLWRKKVLDEVSNSASINQNHFFILYVFVSYLFLLKVICYKETMNFVTEKKSVCRQVFEAISTR